MESIEKLILFWKLKCERLEICQMDTAAEKKGTKTKINESNRREEEKKISKAEHCSTFRLLK